MANLYFCAVRNDITDNGLQLLDLEPNTSQRNPTLTAQGETGYLSHLPQNDTVVTTGVGPIVTSAAYMGLAAYLIDNVENVGGGNISLTAAEAIQIAGIALGAVVAGSDVTLANINIAINVPAGVSNSDLNGVVLNSFSTGTVVEVLRMLAGEVYKLPAASEVAGIAAAFPGTGVLHTPLGSFVASTDTDYRNVRTALATGAVNLSALSGNLSHLRAGTYTFLNPSFTYGAAGTALMIDGTHIPATGAGAAVAIYQNDGTII